MQAKDGHNPVKMQSAGKQNSADKAAKRKEVYYTKEMVIRRIHLAGMPFDRFSNGQFVHATGDYIFTNMGFSGIEYEDYEIPNAPDCVEEWEEDEDDE